MKIKRYWLEKNTRILHSKSNKHSLKTQLNQKILAKAAGRHQRLRGPCILDECTFVCGSFRWVFGSVFSVVFIHFRHCGELWFTLIQPVVWTLLKGNKVQTGKKFHTAIKLVRMCGQLKLNHQLLQPRKWHDKKRTDKISIFKKMGGIKKVKPHKTDEERHQLSEEIKHK